MIKKKPLFFNSSVYELGVFLTEKMLQLEINYLTVEEKPGYNLLSLLLKKLNKKAHKQ